MLNIPGHEQVGILSTPIKVKIDVDAARLIEDMSSHIIKELEEYINNIDLNNYIIEK
ncbi:hypothetical protein NSA42_03160 [Paeniclostridium sordellii]|uniref:hypothetical protein n=1 Tax=Paraclostridium sordellii TaxID=1505 RepID=UPI00214A475D|nr:hypothetical protein [Paeniclostridium sordellii]MCR1848268.1 hypothetical protein [Paeniclostridium sordellii]